VEGLTVLPDATEILTDNCKEIKCVNGHIRVRWLASSIDARSHLRDNAGVTVHGAGGDWSIFRPVDTSTFK